MSTATKPAAPKVVPAKAHGPTKGKKPVAKKAPATKRTSPRV